MSQGTACRCGEHKKPVKERRWVVLQRNARCSAFDGYRVMSSDYSAVQCHACGNVWRTKAAFVDELSSGKNVYDLPADQHPDPAKRFAMVPTGEYTVPLIGVPPSATTEICTRCNEAKHMTELTLDDNSKPVCKTPCKP